MSTINFNANEVEPSTGYDPIPAIRDHRGRIQEPEGLGAAESGKCERGRGPDRPGGPLRHLPRGECASAA